MSSNALKGIQFLEQLDVKDKAVFLRVDFNVPMENGKITDDNRIQGALPTIKYLLEKGARLMLASHLGRPKGKPNPEFSMEPVGQYLSEILGMEVILIDDVRSEAPKAFFKGWKPGQILLLENLRFDPDEEKNGQDMCHAISEYIEVYVNDAFGASHRAHSSIVGLPKMISKKAMGFLMKREIEFLDSLVSTYQSPYVTVLGGSKVSDKIGLIENLIDRVDVFIIGGAMAYTFLKAMGYSTGKSLVENDKIKFSEELLKRIEARDKKILLPQDHLIVPDFNSTDKAMITENRDIPEDWMAVDIGPLTQAIYREEIARAKTIFWNGPMGVFEKSEYSKGTFSLAKSIADNKDCVSVVGGGDSASAAKLSGYAEYMTHISTGGGASLEYLQGDKLPGVEALRI